MQLIQALETLSEVEIAGFGDFWTSTLCFVLRESCYYAQKGKDVKWLYPNREKKYPRFLRKLTFTYDQQQGKKSCSLFFSRWISWFFFFFKSVLKNMHIFVSLRDNLIYHDYLNSKIAEAHSMKERRMDYRSTYRTNWIREVTAPGKAPMTASKAAV